MKAFLKNLRVSPRKVRLVAGALKGKNVVKAKDEVAFIIKRSALPIEKLLKSAVSNAKNQGINEENLFIKELRVDKGVTLHRRMPRAFGIAKPINKRSSHVTIVLEEIKKKVKENNK